MGSKMLISEVVQRTGVSRRTVHHYAELGLLGEVAKRGAYRHYSEDQVHLIRALRYAQTVGLRLSQLGQVTQERNAGSAWEAVLALVAEREGVLRREIEALQREQARLRAYRVKVVECLSSVSA